MYKDVEFIYRCLGVRERLSFFLADFLSFSNSIRLKEDLGGLKEGEPKLLSFTKSSPSNWLLGFWIFAGGGACEDTVERVRFLPPPFILSKKENFDGVPFSFSWSNELTLFKGKAKLLSPDVYFLAAVRLSALWKPQSCDVLFWQRLQARI